MPSNKCICTVRGVRPFISKKYDITKHPHYKHLSDYNKQNIFNTEQHIKQSRKPNIPMQKSTTIEYYDMTA